MIHKHIYTHEIYAINYSNGIQKGIGKCRLSTQITRAIRYGAFIVTQRYKVLHNFVEDDTFKKLYSISFKWYKHKHSVPRSFKLKVILIE